MQELTKEQIQEFERESYENWIDARKQERRNKWREKRNSLKQKLLEPIFMPQLQKSLYEKISDDNIAQRNREWVELEKEWERQNNK